MINSKKLCLGNRAEFSIIEKFKYLDSITDICEVIKIFIEDLRWNNKLLVFTWHFKEEFDELCKPIDFVLEILDKGRHEKISKRQNKYNVFYPFRNRHLCLSYVETENIILIHVKPTGKMPEVRKK